MHQAENWVLFFNRFLILCTSSSIICQRIDTHPLQLWALNNPSVQYNSEACLQLIWTSDKSVCLESELWTLDSTRTMQDQVDSVFWHKKHACLNGVVLCTSLYFFTTFKHISHHPWGWMRIGVVGLSKEICHEISWSIFMLQMLHWSVTNNTRSILGYSWAQQVYPVKSTWTTCHCKKVPL